MVFEQQKNKHAVASADVIVLKDGKILLTKRNVDPYRGAWILPGGHVKVETPVEAAIREVFEETGYKIAVDRLYGVYNSVNQQYDCDPRGPSMNVVFIAHIVGGEPLKTVEVSEQMFCDPSNLPSNIGFHHKYILQDFMKFPAGQPL